MTSGFSSQQKAIWRQARVALFALSLAARLEAQDANTQSKYGTAVRAAEAAGQQYMRESGDTTTRRCTRVTGQVMRSGNFESRGWAGYQSTWERGNGKITWWPQYPQRAESLLVRIVSADSDTATSAFTYRGPPVINRGTGKYMYPSGVRVPHRGAWLFIATAGPNWGCFLYVF